MRYDNDITLMLFKEDGIVKQQVHCTNVLETPCGLRATVIKLDEKGNITKTTFRFFPATSFSEATWGRNL